MIQFSSVVRFTITYLLECFTNDRIFKINIVKVSSETAFLSIVENKQ